MADGDETRLSRRGLLVAASAAVGLSSLGLAASDANGPTDEFGIGHRPDVLQIAPGETYEIGGASTEEYHQVNLQGTLDVQGTLDIDT